MLVSKEENWEERTLARQKVEVLACMKTTSVPFNTTHLHTQTHACSHNRTHCGFSWTNSGSPINAGMQSSCTIPLPVIMSCDVKLPLTLLFYFYSLVAVGKQASLCSCFCTRDTKLPKHHQNPSLQPAAWG